jgi:FKBP-type peptidyl-prolyl cis-trans isomerase
MIKLVFAICAVLFFASCGDDSHKKITDEDYLQQKQKLVDANKKIAKQESDEIDQYALNKGWQMQTSGTGLRQMVIKPGTGDSAKAGLTAKINYKISLLDGTVCYASDKDGARSFKIGQDYVETGLHEAILTMQVGGKSRFILPSHLGHGLLGDFDKIPPRCSIVYEVELLSLK